MNIDFHNNEMSIFIYVCGSDPDSSYCIWSHERPDCQNYTELTFVRIDDDEPMEKVDYDRYLVHDAVACDKQGMMGKLTDAPAYIAYLTNHVYDNKTDSYYHSDPVIVDAKNISSENDNDTRYLFECFFYVNKKGCVAISMDGKNLDYNYAVCDGEEECQGVLYLKFEEFICNDLKCDNSWITFNGRYSNPSFVDDSFTTLMTFDGMDEVLKGHTAVALECIEGVIDEDTLEFEPEGAYDLDLGFLF